MTNALMSSGNAAHTDPLKSAMCTVTFNQNTGPGVNGALWKVEG